MLFAAYIPSASDHVSLLRPGTFGITWKSLGLYLIGETLLNVILKKKLILPQWMESTNGIAQSGPIAGLHLIFVFY